MNTILCINGSDSMGHSGIQSDIRTIKDLGGYAVTAITSVTVQNHLGFQVVHELPTDLVAGQVRTVYEELRPQAVKLGLINNPDTIRVVRDEIVGCPLVVASPVILSSQGVRLMSDDAIHAFTCYLLPVCTFLLIKCADAEIILGQSIETDEDMALAACRLRAMGPGWVLLRGGTYTKGRINALLQGADYQSFFSSVNIEGWQRHGVGGTLSTAIASCLALGEEVPVAVTHAHDYLRSQVVYASGRTSGLKGLQPQNLYNSFMSLLSGNYRHSHDVAFYASRLSISSRYLSQITGSVCGQNPKQIIDNYLLREAEKLLSTTTLTIQEISNHLGFTSQVAFAKFYKSKRGYSPSSFRGRDQTAQSVVSWTK